MKYLFNKFFMFKKHKCCVFIFMILFVLEFIYIYPFIVNKLHWCANVKDENKGGYYLMINQYDEHYALKNHGFCRMNNNCKIWIVNGKVSMEDYNDVIRKNWNNFPKDASSLIFYIFENYFDAYYVKDKDDLCYIDYTNSTIFVDNGGYLILYSNILFSDHVLTYVVSGSNYTPIMPYLKENFILKGIYQAIDKLDKNGNVISKEAILLH